MEKTTWKDFYPILFSKPARPIPSEFKIAGGNASHSKTNHFPSNFDMHIPKSAQLRFVKWAPNLVDQGMQKLRDLYPDQAPASDPGHDFWTRTAKCHITEF
jgi:hypothetical protein